MQCSANCLIARLLPKKKQTNKQTNKQTDTGEIITSSAEEITGLLGLCDAVEKDADEPLERVLVHRVDVGQVRDAEEENLRVDGDRNVLAARNVDISLGLLRDLHLRLSINRTQVR